MGLHLPAGCRQSRRSDGGAASLEIAILGPALLLVIFAVIQAGMWFYARNLALAAAQEGVDAARGYQASSAAGVARAQSFLHRAAGDSLQGVTVSAAGSSATAVRIEVRGRCLSLIPGLAGLPITQSAQGPVERFTTGQP